MAKAPAARQLGDDYQARLFWFHACRLFLPHEKVASVGFESDEPLGFDDVFVKYSAPQPDGYGGNVIRDYFQSKFHVSQTGSFRSDSLISPAFIGTTTGSVFQRLKSAQELAKFQGLRCRYFLVSPWPIHPDDPLAALRDHLSDGFRLDRLANGATSASAMGRVRGMWKEHLKLTTDDELYEILRTFRLHAGAWSFDALRVALNDRLSLAGFQPIATDQVGFPYDDLLRKAFYSGVQEFDRDSLQALAQHEGLWVGPPVPEELRPKVIAVRSFTKWTQQVADAASEFLDLAGYFSGRYILNDSDWADQVLPLLNDFLTEATEDEAPAYELHLDTHASIAFAAGRALSKSPSAVIPVQRTGPNTALRWRPEQPKDAGSRELWTCETLSVPDGDPRQLAVAISVTHDASEDVQAFLAQTEPSVGRVLHVTPVDGVGRSSVRDGAHAWALAEALTRRIRQERRHRDPDSPLHVFASAPNALIFFLGQQSQAWGKCRLYEYDFDSAALGAYVPVLTLSAPSNVAQPASPEDLTQ